MITAQDIQNKALEIAKANPDFNYREWIKEVAEKDENISDDSCVYFVDANMPGCLYGRALDALGFEYEYFRRTGCNEGVAIHSLIEKMMRHGLVEKEPFGWDNPLAREMFYVQKDQDGGKIWGEILEQMEIE